MIGGGGTGSEVAFQLARRSHLRVAIAERDRLGGECNHYGCVPTKAMLTSARIAALARDAGRFGVRIPGVEVDLAAVRERVRRVIDARSGEGPAPSERMGVRVFLQEARLVGPHRTELADGTRVEAARIVLATGTEPVLPPVPGLRDLPVWTNREAIWEPERVPGSLAILGAGAIGAEFAQLYARFGSRVTLRPRDYRVVPRVTFTDPEVASVGLTEAAARAAGHEVATAVARIEDNERAHIDGRTHGLVKLVADRRSGEILGGHIVAEEAGAMIHEVVAAMAGRVPARALADAIHAYPTLSESVRWAAIQLADALDA